MAKTPVISKNQCHPVTQRPGGLLRFFVVASSVGNHRPDLDGVRGCAVLMVIFFHAWKTAGSPKYGWHFSNLLSTCFTGVDLFFILSGFLLAQSWMRSRFLGRAAPDLSRYFGRRWFRIAPGYYCALFFWVTLFIPLITSARLLYSLKGVGVLALHLAMLITLLPVPGQYNPVWWTITVEFIFYLLLPLVVHWFTGNRLFLGLLISALISFCWMTLTLHPPVWLTEALLGFHQSLLGGLIPPDVLRQASVAVLENQLPTYAFVFGLGIFLANLQVRRDLRLAQAGFWKIALSPRSGSLYFIAGVVTVLETLNRYGHQILKGSSVNLWSVTALVSIGFSLLLAGLLFGPAWTRFLFLFPPLRLFGLVGYSAYLWHIPAIYVASQIPVVAALPPRIRFLVIASEATLVTLLLASFFYLTVEKPFLLMRRPAPAAG